MNNQFINCFKAEWIKKRRSFSSWLVLIGGFFVPFISILIFLVYPKQLLTLHASGDFWHLLFRKSWQFMSFMLLPMGIVLAVSLITQIEFKNNSWKHVHTLPVSFSNIYFSKLAVLLVMLLQLFIFFNVGIYLSAVLPSLFNSEMPFPNYSINPVYFLRENINYFIICLPMVSLQYIISMQLRNFLIPIGVGLALVVGGLIALSWKYIYLIPSAYTSLYFLQGQNNNPTGPNLQFWSLCYFVLFISLGYLLYVLKKDKG